jgi:hypothetical protein
MKKIKKLSISELKSNLASNAVLSNIDAIKGGSFREEYCHNGWGKNTTPVRDNTTIGTINPMGGR